MHLFSDYLLGLKGLWFNPSPKDVAVDVSTLQPVRQPESFFSLFLIGICCFFLLDACLLIAVGELKHVLVDVQLCCAAQ